MSDNPEDDDHRARDRELWAARELADAILNIKRQQAEELMRLYGQIASMQWVLGYAEPCIPSEFPYYPTEWVIQQWRAWINGKKRQLPKPPVTDTSDDDPGSD